MVIALLFVIVGIEISRLILYIRDSKDSRRQFEANSQLYQRNAQAYSELLDSADKYK